MENQQFELLESKINQLLSLIKRLRSENVQLVNNVQEIQQQLKQKEQQIQNIQSDSGNIDNMKNQISTYREKEDRIRSKVEVLLKKLDEFDDV